jgi:hypothetical protein
MSSLPRVTGECWQSDTRDAGPVSQDLHTHRVQELAPVPTIF